MAAVSSLEPFSTTTISNERPRSFNPVATSRTDSSNICDSLWAGRTTVRAGGTPVGYRPREARTAVDHHGRAGGRFAALRLVRLAAAQPWRRRRDGLASGVGARPAAGPAGRGTG